VVVQGCELLLEFAAVVEEGLAVLFFVDDGKDNRLRRCNTWRQYEAVVI